MQNIAESHKKGGYTTGCNMHIGSHTHTHTHSLCATSTLTHHTQCCMIDAKAFDCLLMMLSAAQACGQWRLSGTREQRFELMGQDALLVINIEEISQSA